MCCVLCVVRCVLRVVSCVCVCVRVLFVCAVCCVLCIVCCVSDKVRKGVEESDMLFLIFASGGEMGSVALAVLLATSPLLKSLTIVAYQILSDSSDVVGPLNLEQLKLIKYVFLC